MNITRRQLLKYSAALAAASAIGLDLALPKELMGAEADVDKWVKGVCRYCGAGCGVYAGVKGGKVVAVKGDKDNWNKGFLCLKGNFLPAILTAPDRAKHPLLRKGNEFVKISWQEAMDLMVGKFAAAYRKDPQSVAFYGSGQAYTEESYFINKVFKGGLGTNNIDGNPRLCMASAAVGYVSTFGKDEPMGAYDDMYHADCFFIVGSNMAEAHPVIFRIVNEQKKRGAKIIMVDPRKTLSARIADMHMSFIPGSDLAILNSMAHVIVKENLYSKEYVEKYTVFKTMTDPGPPPKIEKVGWERVRQVPGGLLTRGGREDLRLPQGRHHQGCPHVRPVQGDHEPLVHGPEPADPRCMGEQHDAQPAFADRPDQPARRHVVLAYGPAECLRRCARRRSS